MLTSCVRGAHTTKMAFAHQRHQRSRVVVSLTPRGRVAGRARRVEPPMRVVASPRASADEQGTTAAVEGDEDEGEGFQFWKEPSRLALACAWVGLGGFAAFDAPAGTSAFDLELVKSIVGAPFSGAVNPLFESLFNALGIVPATYACLLMPGAKDQKPLPAALCVGASFALGFFALGPYLITRAPRPEAVKRSDLGFVTRNIWESKINALALVAFACYLAYYGVSNLTPENISGFASLFKEQSMLACVSTCDLIVLSLAMGDALAEDMRRRNVDPSNAVAFASLPVVGPVFWLLTRPSLED